MFFILKEGNLDIFINVVLGVEKQFKSHLLLRSVSTNRNRVIFTSLSEIIKNREAIILGLSKKSSRLFSDQKWWYKIVVSLAEDHRSLKLPDSK